MKNLKRSKTKTSKTKTSKTKTLKAKTSKQSISVASAECLKSVKNLKNEEFKKVES